MRSETAVDPLIHERVRARLVEPSRKLVERCAATVPMAVDGELLYDVLAGTVIHRVLVQGRQADDQFISDLLDLVSPHRRD